MYSASFNSLNSWRWLIGTTWGDRTGNGYSPTYFSLIPSFILDVKEFDEIFGVSVKSAVEHLHVHRQMLHSRPHPLLSCFGYIFICFLQFSHPPSARCSIGTLVLPRPTVCHFSIFWYLVRR